MEALTSACQNTNRHEWISVAAYFKSELRGFTPGLELDDWLAAEIDYFEILIKSFLVVSSEDGGMTVSSLRKLAETLGIPEVENICLQTELIRAIQVASKNRPCFQSENSESCGESGDCHWKPECRKMIAVWKR